MSSDQRQVGEVVNLSHRRVIKSAKNPMDKCTIVSIFPVAIEDHKYTIEPGKFNIPSGTFENPSISVIGSSSWWREIDLDQPMLEIPVSSIQVANSIINDYCNGLLGCNMSDSKPGLFFVMGELSLSDIKLKYRNELDKSKASQDNWFKILVRIADSLWARSNGNPLVIWDMMRLAAKSLNMNDKPWLQDFQTVEMIKCVACGGLRNPEFPICPSCKTIDLNHPLAKTLKFAV